MFTKNVVVALVAGLVVGGALGAGVTAAVKGGGTVKAADSGHKVGTEPTQTQTTAAPSTSPPSPSPSSTPAVTIYHLGDKVRNAAGNLVIVYQWHPGADWPVGPDAGKALSQAEVKMCMSPTWNDGGNPMHGYDMASLFSLEYSDSTRVSSESSSYASDELNSQQSVIGPGECARGLVTFQGPAGRTPQDVLFSSSSNIRWLIK